MTLDLAVVQPHTDGQCHHHQGDRRQHHQHDAGGEQPPGPRSAAPAASNPARRRSEAGTTGVADRAVDVVGHRASLGPPRRASGSCCGVGDRQCASTWSRSQRSIRRSGRSTLEHRVRLPIRPASGPGSYAPAPRARRPHLSGPVGPRCGVVPAPGRRADRLGRARPDDHHRTRRSRPDRDLVRGRCRRTARR